jgi:translation initiation factor 2B subunit (eIF-2B alpha/beta/delta family)
MDITPAIMNLIDEIRNDKVHGASQLARQSAKVLKMTAERGRAESSDEFWLELKEVGHELMSTRPAMAPVINIVSRLLKAILGKSTEMDLDSVRQS